MNPYQSPNPNHIIINDPPNKIRELEEYIDCLHQKEHDRDTILIVYFILCVFIAFGIGVHIGMTDPPF